MKCIDFVTAYSISTLAYVKSGEGLLDSSMFIWVVGMTTHCLGYSLIVSRALYYFVCVRIVQFSDRYTAEYEIANSSDMYAS